MPCNLWTPWVWNGSSWHKRRFYHLFLDLVLKFTAIAQPLHTTIKDFSYGQTCRGKEPLSLYIVIMCVSQFDHVPNTGGLTPGVPNYVGQFNGMALKWHPEMISHQRKLTFYLILSHNGSPAFQDIARKIELSTRGIPLGIP